MNPLLRKELRKVRGLSRKLARSLFHAMILNGPKLGEEADSAWTLRRYRR